jgi:hypothetical protein
MPDHPPGALTAAAEALAVHRWKSMGVSSAECECGAVLHGDADPFPADEAFRAHLAAAVLDYAARIIREDEQQRAVRAERERIIRLAIAEAELGRKSSRDPGGSWIALRAFADLLRRETDG